MSMKQCAQEQDWRGVDLSHVDWDEIWATVVEVEASSDRESGTVREYGELWWIDNGESGHDVS